MEVINILDSEEFLLVHELVEIPGEEAGKDNSVKKPPKLVVARRLIPKSIIKSVTEVFNKNGVPDGCEVSVEIGKDIYSLTVIEPFDKICGESSEQ